MPSSSASFSSHTGARGLGRRRKGGRGGGEELGKEEGERRGREGKEMRKQDQSR